MIETRKCRNLIIQAKMADVFVKLRSFCLILYLILLYISFLRQESSLNTSGLHLLNNAVVAREGSSRPNRPLVKFVKHGGLSLAISLDRLILLRCGDVSTNPGPHQKTLSCFMQNVRSLKAFQAVDGSSYESKLGILRDIAYRYDLDVICLSETLLNGTIADHEILPTAYNIYRWDRVGRTGGGVMTAIKSSLSSVKLEVPSDFSSLEMVVVEINNAVFY